MNGISEFLTANDKLVTAWTAIAALLVSSLSIILAVVNTAIQRRHNRKSVQPIGHISVGDYEGQIFVRLRNNGIGPMIVKDLVVTNRNNGETKGSIIDFMPTLPDDCQWSTFVRDMKGRAISANDHVTLIMLEGEADDRRFGLVRKIVRESISPLSISAAYQDIYGKELGSARRDLNWFGRLL
jgi:hypothetical protein